MSENRSYLMLFWTYDLHKHINMNNNKKMVIEQQIGIL